MLSDFWWTSWKGGTRLGVVLPETRFPKPIPKWRISLNQKEDIPRVIVLSLIYSLSSGTPDCYIFSIYQLQTLKTTVTNFEENKSINFMLQNYTNWLTYQNMWNENFTCEVPSINVTFLVILSFIICLS